MKVDFITFEMHITICNLKHFKARGGMLKFSIPTLYLHYHGQRQIHFSGYCTI